MIDVGLAGARGRMGRMLCELIAAADDLRLVSALEMPGHDELGLELADGVKLTDDGEQAMSEAQVWLDFSLAEAASRHVDLAARLERPLVCGATGLSPEQRERFVRAGEKVAVVLGSNMSQGVHLLTQLVRQAAAALGDAEMVDVEIVEAHHKYKKDAPSGTALQLAKAVVEERGGSVVTERSGARKPGEVGVVAVRGGDLTGSHQVLFLGPGEQLVLSHQASTREHFARGALEAVRFAAGRRAGLYGMADVFAALEGR